MFCIQGKDKTMSVLRGLLRDLGAELRDDWLEVNSRVEGTWSKDAEVRMASTLQACGSPAVCEAR